MRSVRRYLVSRVLLGTAGVLALAATIVYVAVARSLERQLDVNLADRVQALASILFQAGESRLKLGETVTARDHFAKLPEEQRARIADLLGHDFIIVSQND